MAVVDEDNTANYNLSSCTKFMIVSVHVIMSLIGATVACLAIWLLSESRGFFANGFIITTGVFLLLAGIGSVILSVIAINGIKGSSSSSTYYNLNLAPILNISLSFMIFFWILSLISLIVSFIFREEFQNGNFRDSLYQSIKNYFDSYLIMDSWDILQSRFKCCGVTKRQFYSNSNSNSYQNQNQNSNSNSGQSSFAPSLTWSLTNPEFRKSNGPRVPESCCDINYLDRFPNYNSFKVNCQGRRQFIYREDCFQVLELELWPRIDTIAFASLAMVIIIFITTITIFWLRNFILSSKLNSSRSKNADSESANNKLSNPSPGKWDNRSPAIGTGGATSHPLGSFARKSRVGSIPSNQDLSSKIPSQPNINSWNK